MPSLRKIDILTAAIIGEVCSWLMVLSGRNLISENPAMASIGGYLYYLPVVFPILCALGLVISYALGKIVPVFFQVGKFVLVGGFNFLLDMAILNILVFGTGIASGPMQSVFKMASFFIAVINSFLLNKYWTFKKTEDSKSVNGAGKEFLQFIIVSLIGLVINVAVDYVAVNLITPFAGMPDKTWAQMGAVFAAAAGMFWNFLGYKFIVFKEKPIVSSVDGKNSFIS